MEKIDKIIVFCFGDFSEMNWNKIFKGKRKLPKNFWFVIALTDSEIVCDVSRYDFKKDYVKFYVFFLTIQSNSTYSLISTNFQADK